MLLTRASARISRKVKMEARRHLNKAAQRAAAAAKRPRVRAHVSDNTASCCAPVLPRSPSPARLLCTCPSKPRASFDAKRLLGSVNILQITHNALHSQDGGPWPRPFKLTTMAPDGAARAGFWFCYLSAGGDAKRLV